LCDPEKLQKPLKTTKKPEKLKISTARYSFTKTSQIYNVGKPIKPGKPQKTDSKYSSTINTYSVDITLLYSQLLSKC